jgi:ABC-2 type transport system ATP-binding protein
MPAVSATVPAVELHGVQKRFDTREALKGVDGYILPGRLTGLVGPDGAGKTTLLRLMAGLLAPSAGRIVVAGLDPVKDGAALADRVGYMPQRFGLYEDLSVIENLRLYADLRGLARDAHAGTFERLLEFTRLGPFTARLAGQLSGGMKQKLGLACALMATPEVLLLDEPGVGVDPVSRAELWRMVEALAGEGMAIVWATAYLDEAERCETVLLLDDGDLRYDGPPGELTARLADRSFRLHGPVADRRGLLARTLDLPGVCDGVIQGDAVRVVLRADASRAELERHATGEHASLEPVAPRFEDAFVDLLGGGPGGHSSIAVRMEPITGGADVVVACRNLTRRFGAFVATDDVSFEVPRGEIFGLLGPNGAGKSTTFKMLCGLLRPSAGEARVAGLDMRRAASQAKLRLGYMAQKFSLYGLLSVGQNLTFAAGVYGLEGAVRRERVDEMVATFALGPFLDTAPEQLPLGFRQRLALACALMHRPAVLFLDEPTSGVDPLTRREFWTHINGLVAKGVTVLVTTHFMDEAEYCDRVALMYRARVIALDTPDALKASVADASTPDPTMEDAFVRLIRQEDQEPVGAISRSRSFAGRRGRDLEIAPTGGRAS